MLFSSPIFIFAFLPTVLIVYYLLNRKYRNYLLLFASIFFYAWGEPKFVLAMLISIVLNFIFGLAINHYRDKKHISKIFLVIAITANISLLLVFKYLNFSISVLNQLFGDILPQTTILLPIGISFFTFQAISYIIDVYRNTAFVQKNIFFVGLYIAFFPQLIAGPIVRYNNIADQIINRKTTFDKFSEGVKRFIIGLGKKVLLANMMAVIADKAFAVSEIGQISVSLAWLGIIAYTFQIFFDFSGYSDMAIGLGLMFGFKFMENFNYPYISGSVTEFWRRWHISLSTWFRDYVYIPLGGSRVKRKSRLVFNLFIVWTLTGIWHGANWNFIAWGLFYFILLTFEKLSGYPDKFKTKFSHVLYRIFTLLCIIGGWVLFRAPNLGAALSYGLSMFGLSGNPLHSDITSFYLSENIVFLIFAVLCSTRLFAMLKNRCENNRTLKKGVNILTVSVYLIILILSVSYLLIESYNPFIYFNF